MYSNEPYKRTHFAVEVDTFLYITAYYMLYGEQNGSRTEEAVIYIYFAIFNSINNNKYKEHSKKLYSKDDKQKVIGSEIIIPDGILVNKNGNDIIAVICLFILDFFQNYDSSVIPILVMQELDK